MANKKYAKRAPPRTSWDPVAHWYNGWVGQTGSEHHRQLAIPAVLDLLEPQPREDILDLGAGQGVLAPFIAEAGAKYTGVDISPRLLRYARKYHGKLGRFMVGDSRKLSEIEGLSQGEFDGVVFLLSIQDMNPLEEVLASAAWALKAGGRVVILMTHPCFRIPRQSGWGWDEGRKLRYRRIDRYLISLPVPMKAYPGQQVGTTYSFHHPLEKYVNGMARVGLVVDCMKEIPGDKIRLPSTGSKADERANQEIPLFLGLRAKKLKIDP